MPLERHPLAAPPGFHLGPTIRSHGWSDLAPFEADPAAPRLGIRLGRVRATVEEDAILLDSARRLGRGATEEALAAVRACLHFDLDLEPFWELCRADPELSWAARIGAGRFLRAPTLFHDALMVLATTNCSWALTRRMVGALAAHYGEDGALPDAARLRAVAPQELRERASVGYRAPYFAALASEGDLEGLRGQETPTADLRARLLALQGFGPYAAENLLRLLGRFEHLALDSWVRKAYGELYPRAAFSERAVARRFARYGRWKGLALWLAVTRSWYEEPPAAAGDRRQG